MAATEGGSHAISGGRSTSPLRLALVRCLKAEAQGCGQTKWALGNQVVCFDVWCAALGSWKRTILKMVPSKVGARRTGWVHGECLIFKHLHALTRVVCLNLPSCTNVVNSMPMHKFLTFLTTFGKTSRSESICRVCPVLHAPSPPTSHLSCAHQCKV